MKKESQSNGSDRLDSNIGPLEVREREPLTMKCAYVLLVTAIFLVYYAYENRF